MRNAALVLLLAASSVVSGCGGGALPKEPPVAAQREVAQRFAEAIFGGSAGAAAALLVHPDDEALSSRATHAAAGWRARHGTVRLPGKHSGSRWTFAYAGTHSHRDGRFERVRGDLVVVVAATPKGAGVEYFAFLNERIRFSTHHDSVLLPSSR
jgi:hypothetical protein